MAGLQPRAFQARSMGLFIVIAAGLGCVPTSPLVINQTYAPPSSGSFDKGQGGIACRIQFLSVTDQRMDKTALGTLAGRPVRAPQDTAAWLRSVLKALPTKGVDVSFDGSDHPPGIAIQAEAQLVTAWVTGIESSMSANVVLRVRFHLADGSIDEHLYRGYETSVNWSSGDAEIQDLLNQAFDRVLEKLALDATALSHPTLRNAAAPRSTM